MKTLYRGFELSAERDEEENGTRWSFRMLPDGPVLREGVSPSEGNDIDECLESMKLQVDVDLVFLSFFTGWEDRHPPAADVVETMRQLKSVNE